MLQSFSIKRKVVPFYYENASYCDPSK